MWVPTPTVDLVLVAHPPVPQPPDSDATLDVPWFDAGREEESGSQDREEAEGAAGAGRRSRTSLLWSLGI